jgi:hypothetical protein
MRKIGAFSLTFAKQFSNVLHFPGEKGGMKIAEEIAHEGPSSVFSQYRNPGAQDTVRESRNKLEWRRICRLSNSSSRSSSSEYCCGL